MTEMPESVYQRALEDAVGAYRSLAALEPELRKAASICTRALAGGGKLLICGNGGSAAEAQHLAGELMGRYKGDRVPLPAVAFTADSALLTCIGNDYCFDEIFARQFRGLARPGDVLIVFTTSGNSPNVLLALEAARAMKAPAIAFLGGDGGKAKSAAACALIVPHRDTARVQEGHQFLMHCLMDEIESWVQEAAPESSRSGADSDA
jgi:D-sedoheptulose 7-phosphate isomerase